MTTDDAEVWKTIPSFPFYQASSIGRVRRDPSHPTNKGPKPEVLAATIGKHGYVVYRLKRGERWVCPQGHVLVCEAFHGPKPSPKHEVAHGDGVRSNNRPSNLRWATRAENHADKKIHGTNREGEAIPWAKLRESDIPVIRDRLANHESMRKIADDYGVSEGAINGIRIGRNWKSVAGGTDERAGV